MQLKRRVMIASCLLLTGLGIGPAVGSENRILVQSTTSTQNSGLYSHILPLFQERTGIRVDVVAVGTGQAIRNASQGDADVLLVHAKEAEEAFVASGHGVARHPLMYNDFVLIGPASDPARLARADGLGDGLTRLSAGAAPFLSRGDDSGTHKKERKLWASADLAPGGQWYRETGSGMGTTIRMAIEMGAYTITDRASWIAFPDKGNHQVLFQGDPALFNQYGVIQIDPARHDHVNATGAKAFVDWLLGEQGQAAIAAYKVDGQQLFFPNAGSGS